MQKISKEQINMIIGLLNRRVEIRKSLRKNAQYTSNKALQDYYEGTISAYQDVKLMLYRLL